MTTTLTDLAPAPWMTEGACRDEDPDLFFPISAIDTGDGQIARATRICAGCPVMDECLEYALENRIKHGVWGGRTEQQRQSLIRARRRPRLESRPRPHAA
jgi:WhiB family transcriptional regulator, redox-sensing transcriptional regulator